MNYIWIDVERLRHLLWNGYHNETYRLLASIVSMSSNLMLLNGPIVEPKAWRFAELCDDLRIYIWNNHDVMIDYGRINKRRQMRWSPRGADRVLQVRAAVLDGRLDTAITPLAA